MIKSYRDRDTECLASGEAVYRWEAFRARPKSVFASSMQLRPSAISPPSILIVWSV